MPVDFMTVRAEETSKTVMEENTASGNFGDNDGFTWSYDYITEIMTVTGQDSGLNNMMSEVSCIRAAKKVVFQNCVVSGSMQGMLKGCRKDAVNFITPASYTNNTETFTLKASTQKGYTFSGWYSDDKYKKKVTKINKGSISKVTLYAKWSKNKTKK